MKKFCTALIAIAVIIAGWYGIWHNMLTDDVVRVKASIVHHDAAFRATNRFVTLKADGVSRAGFPFAFRVKVARPILSMVWGKERFEASLPWIELNSTNSGEGRYKVTMPLTADALYTTENAAPEKYKVALNEAPQILLRAMGTSVQCPNIPGNNNCPAVAADAPLISFAAALPEKLVLTVKLNDEIKEVSFKSHPISIPIFFAIPADASNELMIFVGMLREAMIYSK